MEELSIPSDTITEDPAVLTRRFPLPPLARTPSRSLTLAALSRRVTTTPLSFSFSFSFSLASFLAFSASSSASLLSSSLYLSLHRLSFSFCLSLFSLSFCFLPSSFDFLSCAFLSSFCILSSYRSFSLTFVSLINCLSCPNTLLIYFKVLMC